MAELTASDLARERRPLPVGSIGHHTFGFWGMLFLILTEGALFSFLLFSYYYTVITNEQTWPPSGMPKFHLALPNTVVLILSSVAVGWGERGVRRGDRRRLLIGLGIGLLLGLVFLGVQVEEWREKPFTFTSGPYGSLFFTVTGFHMAHVVAGVIVLAALLAWSALGYFDRERNAPVTIGALYWHFVDVVWLAVFFTFYVTPYLGLR